MADLFTRRECVEAFAPTSEHLKQSFRELALVLSSMGASINVPIRPYVLSSLPHFGALSLSEQQNAVMKLAQYVSICQDVIASGGSLKSSRTFVWRAFRAFGWKPSSKLFESMDEDHIVEVYDFNNVQLFRNMKFFEYCSYTLEDIFTRPWMNLFVRENPEQTEELVKCMTDLAASKSHETIFPSIATQKIYEVDSELKNRMNFDIESLTLLFDSTNQPAAFLSCERAEFN